MSKNISVYLNLLQRCAPVMTYIDGTMTGLGENTICIEQDNGNDIEIRLSNNLITEAAEHIMEQVTVRLRNNIGVEINRKKSDTTTHTSAETPDM